MAGTGDGEAEGVAGVWAMARSRRETTPRHIGTSFQYTVCIHPSSLGRQPCNPSLCLALAILGA
jgi:hypothetical protein